MATPLEEDPTISAPLLTPASRLMLIAPHPDDEALACSIILQQARRAGAAIRVVYATDGEDNPWPQRALERKWHLDAGDRGRWGKLRRAEALAALHSLGVSASDAQFLGLPDQRLTDLLTGDCRPALDRLETLISDWAPTDLLVPSIADTHPDHSALAVMVRIILAELFTEDLLMNVWSYAVHGKSRTFLKRASKIPQSEIERAIKVQAICCHKTQIKLSRRRFVGYADRPERLLKLASREKPAADGSIRSVTRGRHILRLELRLSARPLAQARPRLFLLGRDPGGDLICLHMRLPVRSDEVELFDSVSGHSLETAQYHGDRFAGEIVIPIGMYSPFHAIFLKLERPTWFFDEAGWLEIPGAIAPRKARMSTPQLEGALLAIS